MYHQYIGLTEPAFSIAVNPRYLYMSEQHKEALANLLYGVQGGGFVLLTGEVGTGKTTIIRSLLEQLPEATDLAMVFNPMAEVAEMLQMICDELGANYDPSRATIKELTDTLQARLLDNHRRGRHTVLLIDEAQLLSAEALEQIRLLTNLETNTQKLLQIILVGQPELNRLLSQPRLRQLSQRITARFHLNPLTLEETRAYIQHRLQVAGMQGGRTPFPDSIVRKIHRFSGGIPRRINILCERALVGLYGHNKERVDGRILSMAKKEVSGDNGKAGLLSRVAIALLVAALVLVIMGFLLSFAVKWFDTLDGENRFRSESSLSSHSDDSAGSRAGISNENPSATDVSSKNASETIPARSPESDRGGLTKDASHSRALALSLVGNNTIERLSDAQAQLALVNGLSDPLVCLSGKSYPIAVLTRDTGSQYESRVVCEVENISSWQSLSELNRPAILTLVTPEKFRAYAVVVGVESGVARVLDAVGDERAISLAELGSMWTGQVLYMWHKPEGFTTALSQGDRGPVVAWLAAAFAYIDGQPQPLSRNVFTAQLAARLKIFQENQGLAVDGILGQKTLLRINEVLGIDRTLGDTVRTNAMGAE